MKIHKHITPPETCTGCGLCANICPKGAIQMIQSDEGFYIPEVNNVACVECGLCTTQCIALTPQVPSDRQTTAYGAWNKDDEERFASSSGGIFSVISKHIINQGGCVFGVAWRDIDTAEHIKIETQEELAILRGSKYVQADVGMVYQQVKTELQKQRWVLLSGTPCQIQALRRFLKKDYEKLVTIDIVCHGTPSQLLLKEYIKQSQPLDSKIANIYFRDKSTGWLSYSIRHTLKNGISTLRPVYKDTFMKLFLSDMFLNKACYQCAFSQGTRSGDITLGDFWGVDRCHPTWPMEKGISAVLVNTSKGKKIWSEIANSIQFEAEDYTNFTRYQTGFSHHMPIPVARDHDFRLLQKGIPLKQIEKELCDTKKIGPFKLDKNGPIFLTLRKIKRICKRIIEK